MARHEFSKPTKREARRRSGEFCEAVGEVYGLPPGQRCNAPLSKGVEYDHYPFPAGDPGSDTLDNCVACCLSCHRWKTSHYDVPVLAKGKRTADKHNGITGPKQPIHSPGFHRPPSNTRDIWDDTPADALPQHIREAR